LENPLNTLLKSRARAAVLKLARMPLAMTAAAQAYAAAPRITLGLGAQHP
jgi:hypothetical protein